MREKVTFEFLLRLSVFYFLFSATPTGFLTFCLPADEATAKSVTKYSPTDLEKQTAVDCKDNGLFSLTKPSLCQNTIHVSQDPARAAVAHYARNGACLVCVCVCLVCVCVSLKDTLIIPSLAIHSRLPPKNTLHIKIYAQHNFPTLQYCRAVLPYQPAREKSDFRISTSIFCILLSFFCHPHGFLNFLFAR